MFTESAPSCSYTANDAGFTGPTRADTLNVVSAGSTPCSRSRCSVHRTPSSATSRHFTPSSQARSASSTQPARASWPRARSPAPPESVRNEAPVSQLPRGPVNRQSSMERSAQPSTMSVISVSLSIQTPLPWLIRCTGTSSRALSFSTTDSASGPSTDGISVRHVPPSGKECGDASAGEAAGAPSPSPLSAGSPGRRAPVRGPDGAGDTEVMSDLSCSVGRTRFGEKSDGREGPAGPA